MIGVKVRLHDAVFYGFPYKLRPKPKIALVVSSPESAGRSRKIWSGYGTTGGGGPGHSYGGPGVHSDVASAAGPPMFRIVSAMFPQYFRSLSALFSQHLRSVSALKLSPRTVPAVFPQSFRTVPAAFPHCFRSSRIFSASACHRP